jgi:hypothetical protein
MSEYGVIQPFPQLGRPIFVARQEERNSQELVRFTDSPSQPGRTYSLTVRGWKVDGYQGGGSKVVRPESRPGADDAITAAVGALDFVGAVRIWSNTGATFGDLTPREFSELCFDVSLLEVVPNS